MFIMRQFLKLFILIINIISFTYTTIINGYFYDIFRESEISTKNIIESYFENNKKEFGIKPDVNLIITVSNTTNYEDYIKEVKNEIKQSKYHCFLIDENSLFDDYSYYHDGEIDFLKNYNEIDVSATDDNRIQILTKDFEENYFYTYTLPLNKYLKYDDEKSKNSGYINYRIYEDGQLNNNYYAYPFSASYDLLFYNKKLLNQVGVVDFNILENWSDIERIILEYQQKIDNTKYGINMGLDSPDSFMSFLLEYFHIKNNESYNECATGQLQSKMNSKSNKIKYYDYNKCGLGYEIFYEDNIKKEASEGHIFRSMKYILNSHIINPNSLSYNESQALENFLNGESIFFKGNYSSFINIVKRIYISSNDFTLSSALNSPKNNNTINSILQNINLTTENIFKENDQFGVTVLPNGYSTYSGYVLIGNNHKNFSQLYDDITQIIVLLTSEKAQIDRSINYNISPAFNYNSIEEEEKESSSPTTTTTMCQSIPCHIYKKLKPISLTKTFSNKESVTFYDITKNFYGLFKKYYYEGDDITLQNVLLDKIKTLLTVHHIKWCYAFAIIFGILGSLYGIILIRLIYKNRNEKIIKKSYPVATIIFIIGMSYHFIDILVEILLPLNNIESTFEHHLITLELIGYSAYLYKLWKMNIKINKDKFKICGLNLSKLPIILILIIHTLIFITVNILWDIKSPRKYIALIYYNKSVGKYERLPLSYSTYEKYFIYILTFIETLPIIMILYLAYTLRKESIFYDEFKGLMYSILIIIIGVIGKSYAFYLEQEIRVLIMDGICLIEGISILTLVVLPKILEVKYRKKLKKNNPPKNNNNNNDNNNKYSEKSLLTLNINNDI
ncbi:hypothetical protein BCR32DRAFT_266033 [Anaeromyces robustus]|uniref:G-protein coupled receptors family 3 profile domain-containing protein n=1 Tax=Anaeromyces robustus TaxID=1754192 RepID=A0A1Y1XHL5_9FUNG|nr:hypothetical protein BCR32DRAFT_266033 [Anaeromyces robustus]|eukprot:ORX84886.1 hypothetical protein BCR32DRAFT_266033 [Anaeromyces robustus]